MRTARGRLLVVSSVVLVLLWLGTGWPGSGTSDRATRELITNSISSNELVTLGGNTRREANAANDRGAVAANFPLPHLMLQLRRPAERQRAFDQYVEQLTAPSSPNFHRWLNAGEIGARYGLAQGDIDKITGWLRTQGFTINTVYPNKAVIDFSGTAGNVQSAFHTEIHRLDVNGVTHFANMSDPQIPVALAGAIAGIASLNDFRPQPLFRPRANYTVGNGIYALVPADLATIYNLNPLFDAGIAGKGQTIVVIEDSDVFATADWKNFRSTFKLSSKYPQGSFTQIHPAAAGNSCSDPGVNADDVEAIVDTEWASAAAPAAAIETAACANTATFGGFIAMQNLLNGTGRPPAIISISYGEDEADLGAANNAFINSLYEQAAAMGVSVFVAAGDSGAASSDHRQPTAVHGITASGFSSTPYDVSVGGTDFGDTFAGTNHTYWAASNDPAFGSALSYIPEIPWNDSCASSLITTYSGFSVSYGAGGFCNSASAEGAGFVNTYAGGGAPSGCATGVASQSGSNGGSCAGYVKPSWQAVVGNPADGVRDTPDISLFAADGVWGHYYLFCYSDPTRGGSSCAGSPNGWAGGGGTSFSAPIMAGIQALANEKLGGPQGNPDPAYYRLAAAEYGAAGSTICNSSRAGGADSSCAFYDVTQGDMDVACTGTLDCYLPAGSVGALSTSDATFQSAYSSGTGWDFASGLGSVNAANLVDALAAPSATPTPSGSPTASASPTPSRTATPTPTATATARPATGAQLRVAPAALKMRAIINPRRAAKLTSRFVTLTNRRSAKRSGGTASVAISSISTGSSVFTPSQNCVGTLATGKRCRVEVTFDPASVGSFTDQLTISSNAANGSAQTVKLSGVATQRK